MRMPARAGPIRPAAANPPSSRLFACDIVVTSSPTSSGRITRCEAAYGGMNAPIAATIASSTPNDRRPAECSSGNAMISGARAKSAMSIVVREPSFCTSVPLGTPRIAIGRICDGEDDAHLRRRARRDEHEPRQGEIRHPRAERRDQLGEDECADSSLVHVLHAGRNNNTSVRFCKVRMCRRSPKSTRSAAANRSSRAPAAALPATATRARRSHGSSRRSACRAARSSTTSRARTRSSSSWRSRCRSG